LLFSRIAIGHDPTGCFNFSERAPVGFAFASKHATNLLRSSSHPRESVWYQLPSHLGDFGVRHHNLRLDSPLENGCLEWALQSKRKCEFADLPNR
jgi:hypothetical protein